ncbi:DNA repair protein RecO [Candidatus Marinamargulisbacteria bacterium SCGC AG-410-N11]|nr:DNA repair protein RecO [Candidatus Marinamargulisbacteria bacterium SCGC AG-410-N11]
MKLLKTTGIIFSSKNFFEKDQRLELLTHNLGRITLLAKNVYKKKSSLIGSLVPTNIIQCNIYNGKSFQLLTEWSLINSFPYLKQNFNLISLSSYFINIIKNITDYKQPTPELFNLLSYSLIRLNKKNICPNTIQYEFLKSILNNEGILAPTSSISAKTLHNLLENYCSKKIPLPMHQITKEYVF